MLAHVEDLLKSPRQNWNLYTVFEELVDVWLRREERKLRIQYAESTQRLPDSQQLLYACIRVAEAMQRLDKRSLTQDDLLMLVASSDENIRWLADEAFDVGGRSLLNRNSEGSFRFSHYTIQEYLLAAGILRGLLSQHENLRPTDQLMKFLKVSSRLDYLECFDWKQVGVEFLRKSPPIHDMIKISAGRFRMGSNKHESEAPIHIVTIDYEFLMGKYPVTFAEYDFYCEQTGKEKPNDEGWGRDQRPVINVRWSEAVAYCQWLNELTGQQYRLPSEAEWEYACRAGTLSDYWWGNQMHKNRCWYHDNANGQTHPVDEQEAEHANSWGLVDMHGHVWEWCQDLVHNDYNDAPTDGSAWKTGNSESRLLRGGSWNSSSDRCRTAFRGHDYIDRDSDIGFRLVRLL